MNKLYGALVVIGLAIMSFSLYQLQQLSTTINFLWVLIGAILIFIGWHLGSSQMRRFASKNVIQEDIKKEMDKEKKRPSESFFEMKP